MAAKLERAINERNGEASSRWYHENRANYLDAKLKTMGVDIGHYRVGME